MFYKTENDGFINMNFMSNIYVEGVDFGSPIPDGYMVNVFCNKKLVLKHGFKSREDAENWIILLLNNTKNKGDFEFEDLPE